MSRIKVGLEHPDPAYPDWVMWCQVHDSKAYCGSWDAAYEAAVGHACMEHPRDTTGPDPTARIAAVLRLLEPDDITPTGARQIRRVLEGDQ